MTGNARAAAIGGLALALWIGTAGGARAGDGSSAGMDQAADAYDQATKAHNAGDYAGAARLFARADELAPNPVALETALREALLADLPVLGMKLAERARRQSELGSSLSDLVARAREKLSSRVGIVVVQCAGCSATLDGEGLGPELRGFVAVGATGVVEMRVGDRTERREVVGASGSTVTVAPTAPVASVTAGALPGPPIAPALPPRPPSRAPDEGELDGIHPAWLTFGIAGTVALAAGSVGSYVDALAIESALQDKRDAGDLDGAAELAAEGQNAEIRTYVLEGLLAGSAVATLAVAVFAVDWDGKSPRAQLSVGPGSIAVSWRF